MRPLRQFVFVLGAVFSLAAARPQTPDSYSQAQQALLSHLAAQADDLQRRLPGFTCNETILSQEIRDGKVRRRVSATTTIQAQRNAQDVLDERLGVLTFDVSPLAAMVHHIPSVPLFVSGGFSHALDYFVQSNQACYRYRFSPGRIDFAPVAFPSAACKGQSATGFALLDADGDVTHLERTASPTSQTQVHFAAIDFAPVELHGNTYRLSRHVFAEMPVAGGFLGRFTADFSNWKLFTATITIHPGDGELQP